jgi:hypothetical protein
MGMYCWLCARGLGSAHHNDMGAAPHPAARSVATPANWPNNHEDQGMKGWVFLLPTVTKEDADKYFPSGSLSLQRPHTPLLVLPSIVLACQLYKMPAAQSAAMPPPSGIVLWPVHCLPGAQLSQQHQGFSATACAAYPAHLQR